MFSRPWGRKGGDVCAIVLHAGAGFHSKENQKRHLQACSEAASLAMSVLKSGGSAVDAVEMAVRVLEDREITNAGYGSNLTIDGTVECDASIVDEYGRSGAVGAVAHVRNPISLARVVLVRSLKPLSLRRIPPNLLVGDGATDFAFSHGIPVLPHDALVSPAARERWQKWKKELLGVNSRSFESSESLDADVEDAVESSLDYEEQVRRRQRLQHRDAMDDPGATLLLTPVIKHWNSVGTASPPPSLALSDADSPRAPGTPGHEIDVFGESPPVNGSSIPAGNNILTMDTLSSLQASPHVVGFPGQVRALRDAKTKDGRGRRVNRSDTNGVSSAVRRLNGYGPHDGSEDATDGGRDCDTSHLSRNHSGPSLAADAVVADHGLAELPAMSTGGQVTTVSAWREFAENCGRPNGQRRSNDMSEDLITDTVGAIAIDSYGKIAAGSSSGGIGMKHRGRVGPAALVGVGTAVIPQDPGDKEKISVATVASGTGEHIATTMAASTCAERLYHSTRNCGAGRMDSATEDMVMQAVIDRDFMGHPSVRHSPASGAIGLLAAKKTADGIYIYFAHNTDSFAVASMHSDERSPTCTMSRNKGNGSIAQGARAIRCRR